MAVCVVPLLWGRGGAAGPLFRLSLFLQPLCSGAMDQAMMVNGAGEGPSDSILNVMESAEAFLKNLWGRFHDWLLDSQPKHESAWLLKWNKAGPAKETSGDNVAIFCRTCFRKSRLAVIGEWPGAEQVGFSV